MSVGRFSLFVLINIITINFLRVELIPFDIQIEPFTTGIDPNREFLWNDDYLPIWKSVQISEFEHRKVRAVAICDFPFAKSWTFEVEAVY